MFTSAGLVVAICAWLTGLGLMELADGMGGPDRRTRRAVERHGVGLLLGIAALTTLYVTFAVYRHGPVPVSTGRWIAYAPALVGGLAWLRGMRIRARRGVLRETLGETRSAFSDWKASIAGERGPAALFAAAGFATAAVLGVYFACFAVFWGGSMPMYLFDSVFHFGYKGKVLFYEGFGGTGWMIRPHELELGDGIGRVMTHPNYPPGIPALHCLVGSQLGDFSEHATRALMGLFVVGGAALLWSFLRDRSRGAAAAGVLAWTSLPFLYYSNAWFKFVNWRHGAGDGEYLSSLHFVPQDLWHSVLASWMNQRLTSTAFARFPTGWTLDGSADLPQAVMFCAGILFAWRCLRWAGRRVDRGDALVAGVLLGGSALVKNEGMALLMITVVSLGAFWVLGLFWRTPTANDATSHRRSLIDLGLAFAIAFVMASPWLSIRDAIPSIDEDYPEAIKMALGLVEPTRLTPDAQPTSIGEALARLPVVLGGFAVTAIHVLRWNLVWILFLAAVGLWLFTRPRRLLAHPVAPLLLAIAGTLGAYGLILVVTPWDLPHLYTTAIPDRIMLHVAPLVIACSIALLWRFPEEWFGRRQEPVTEPAPPVGGGTEPTAVRHDARDAAVE